jgi:hypothetical protein
VPRCSEGGERVSTVWVTPNAPVQRRAAQRTVRCNWLLDALNRQLTTASAHPYQVCTCHMCSSGRLLPELLREPN